MNRARRLAWSLALALAGVVSSVTPIVAPARGQEAPPRPDEQTLRERVEASEGKERGAAAAELAKLLDGESRWSEAASAWRQARKARGDVSDFEGEARALLAFAEDIVVQGEGGGSVSAAFEDAKTALRRAREAGSKSVEIALGLARCAEVGDDAETRIAELSSAHAAAPGDVRAAGALVAALAAVGRADEAMALCSKVSDAHPGDVELQLVLSGAAQLAGDEARQRTTASRATAAAPDDGRGWSALWRLYASKKRWAELADVYLEIARAHPEGRWVARYTGIACSQALRFDEALAWLEKAWERNKKDAVARTEAGRILYYHKNDRAGAARLYAEALAADPSSNDAYLGIFYMARRYDAEGDKFSPLPLFELLMQARPQDVDCWNNYANALRFAGRYEACEEQYIKAIEAFPGDAQLRNDYALLLGVMGRPEDARVVLEASHEVDSSHTDSVENLGFLARNRGDRAQALKWFRLAREALVKRGADDTKLRTYVDDQRWPLPPLRQPNGR